MTVRRAVEAAGGFSSIGDARRVTLERDGNSPQELDLTLARSDAALEIGDRVVVGLLAARRYVVVAGDVKSPGPVQMRPGMTVSQAILEAGGANPKAHIDKVRLIRQTAKGKVHTVHAIGKAMKGFASDPEVIEGDRIEVPAQVRSRSRNSLAPVLSAVLLFFIIGR